MRPHAWGERPERGARPDSPACAWQPLRGAWPSEWNSARAAPHGGVIRRWDLNAEDPVQKRGRFGVGGAVSSAGPSQVLFSRSIQEIAAVNTRSSAPSTASQWAGVVWKSSHERSSWEEPRQEPDDAANKKVLLIGDSVMRGLEKILTKHHAKNWRVDSNEGCEALAIPIGAEDMEAFDHVVYVTSGNGLWKDEWSNVEMNVSSLDPKKVSVILLGTAVLWHTLYGGDSESKPKNEAFFEQTKSALLRQRVDFTEVIDFMQTLEYSDTEGHPSKNARWELAQKVVEVVNELVARKAV